MEDQDLFRFFCSQILFAGVVVICCRPQRCLCVMQEVHVQCCGEEAGRYDDGLFQLLPSV